MSEALQCSVESEVIEVMNVQMQMIQFPPLAMPIQRKSIELSDRIPNRTARRFGHRLGQQFAVNQQDTQAIAGV
jgi:hypothetical protein